MWRPHTSRPPRSGSWVCGSGTSSSEVPTGRLGLWDTRRSADAEGLSATVPSAAGAPGPGAAGHGRGTRPPAGDGGPYGGAPDGAEPAARAGGVQPGWGWAVSRLPPCTSAPSCLLKYHSCPGLFLPTPLYFFPKIPPTPASPLIGHVHPSELWPNHFYLGHGVMGAPAILRQPTEDALLLVARANLGGATLGVEYWVLNGGIHPM